MIVAAILMNKVGIAGTFLQAQMTIKNKGSKAHQEIIKFWLKTVDVFKITELLM